MTAMSPSEVSKKLGIQPSTLRKYSLLLEQHGLEFERNANNSRKYTEESVIALQRLITLIGNGDMTVEQAATIVGLGVQADEMLFGKSDHSDTDNATHNTPGRHNDDITAAMFKEIMNLKEEIQEQKGIIDGFRIAQERRDKYFVEILEQLQDEIIQLNEQKALPPVEEPKQEEEPKKKGFLSRFFK